MVDQGWSHPGSRVSDPLQILDPSRSWTPPDPDSSRCLDPLDHPTRPLWLSTTLLTLYTLYYIVCLPLQG